MRSAADRQGYVIVANRNPQLGLMEDHLALLKASNEVVQLEPDYTDEQMSRLLPKVDVIVSIYMASVTAQMMDEAPRLRGIVTYGSGYNHIDVAAATERGIYMCNNAGMNAEAVAEHAFSLILNLTRRTYRADSMVRDGKWRRGSALPSWLSGSELWKKTLGIVGLGNIGRRVARIGGGFEMQILACDPYVSVEAAREVGATLVALETLFREADILTLHVPRNAETEGLVNAERLALMRPTAYLINTCRGPVVDEGALVAALKAGQIAGAGLDVFAAEPLIPDHPLLRFENVILTPHFAGRTAEAKEGQSAGVVRQVLQILAGDVPDKLINDAVLGGVGLGSTQGWA